MNVQLYVLIYMPIKFNDATFNDATTQPSKQQVNVNTAVSAFSDAKLQLYCNMYITKG